MLTLLHRLAAALLLAFDGDGRVPPVVPGDAGSEAGARGGVGAVAGRGGRAHRGPARGAGGRGRARGPKTEKVIVVVSLVPEEDPKVAASEEALMAVPAVPVEGDVVTLKVGDGHSHRGLGHADAVAQAGRRVVVGVRR